MRCQGERHLAVQNKSLGRFALHGIRSAPRRIPRIDITFEIDENGIVHVFAIDQATGVHHQVVITANSGLSEAEIQSMVIDAQVFAEIDHAILEEAELRVKGATILRMVNAQLDELGQAVPVQDLARFDRGILRLREALENEDMAEVRAAMDALSDLCKRFLPLNDQDRENLAIALTAPK